MATEIERKFLTADKVDWAALGQGQEFCQGYLSLKPEASVRLRIAGEQAFLTIKGKTSGVSRTEFEYPIPVADARQMLAQLCEKPLIEKTRYFIPYGQHTWEVDVFSGDNQGLVVAEIELKHSDETFLSPQWLGQEVSDDARYFNSNLIKHPYCQW
jgi:CYTH domain-containing protein